MKSQEILDLIDADGCVYNHKYQILLMWLMNCHGQNVHDLLRARLLERQSAIVSSDVEKIIQTIKQEITEVDFKSLKLHQMLKPLAWNAKEAAQFIKMLNEIDESIMQLIFVKSNEKLLKFLMHENEQHELQSIGIGSSRQTHKYDVRYASMNGTGRIFHDLYYLTKSLRKNSNYHPKHVSLTALTLTDIGDSRSNGENYKRIMTHGFGPRRSLPDERSKVPILYAMSHDMATQYREAEITIHFYDNDFVIIAGLKSIFKRYPELLPEQVTLVLHRYNGEFNSTTTIKGKGPVDENYRHNVTLMLKMAKKRKGLKALRKSNVVTDINFEDFIANRICKINQNVSTDDIRFSTMFSNKKLLAESEFEELADNGRRLFHIRHRDCIRLFALAAPRKQISENKINIDGFTSEIKLKFKPV